MVKLNLNALKQKKEEKNQNIKEIENKDENQENKINNLSKEEKFDENLKIENNEEKNNDIKKEIVILEEEKNASDDNNKDNNKNNFSYLDDNNKDNNKNNFSYLDDINDINLKEILKEEKEKKKKLQKTIGIIFGSILIVSILGFVFFKFYLNKKVEPKKIKTNVIEHKIPPKPKETWIKKTTKGLFKINYEISNKGKYKIDSKIFNNKKDFDNYLKNRIKAMKLNKLIEFLKDNKK